MANTAVAVTTLTAGTVSADVITNAAGGTSVSAANTAVIAAVGDTSNLFITFYASSAATATLQAGDNPPSLNAGLGAGTAQTLPAGDVLVMTVPAGRYVQDDGSVHILIGTNTTVVGAFRIPRSS